jgi:hypothetical protein
MENSYEFRTLTAASAIGLALTGTEGTQQGIAEFLQHKYKPEPPGILILEAARAEPASFNNRLASESGVAITCEVRTGAPAAQIVASANVHAIDLTVIGHRGHNRLAQMLLGSVARCVLDTAFCPVLIVR